MIKTNIKMVVTPEESKQVQEICFANGIIWIDNTSKIDLTNKVYLLIYTNIRWCFEHEYYDSSLEVVDASLFIKTKGTCVEETPEQDLKQNNNNNKEETMEKNEVESYKDVKKYLIAKGLYERVLEIDWETYEEDTFSGLFTWSKTEEGHNFWNKLNGELEALNINENIESLVQDYKAKQGKEFIEYIETKSEEVVEAQPDEYADLRKALRVGKIIQLNGSAVNGGYGETWNDCKQEDLFVWGRDAYRIKPTEQKPKQYLCYVQGKSLPKHIHKTLEQAKQEAQRLCRKELTKVRVLEVVAEYEAEVLVKEVL